MEAFPNASSQMKVCCTLGLFLAERNAMVLTRIHKMSPIQPTFHKKTYITRKERNAVIRVLSRITTPRSNKDQSDIQHLTNLLEESTIARPYIDEKSRERIDELISKYAQDMTEEVSDPFVEQVSIVSQDEKMDAFVNVIRRIAALSKIDLTSSAVLNSLTQKLQAATIQEPAGPITNWEQYFFHAKEQMLRELGEMPREWDKCQEILRASSKEAFPDTQANLVDDVFIRCKSLYEKLREDEQNLPTCASLQILRDSMIQNCERLEDID